MLLSGCVVAVQMQLSAGQIIISETLYYSKRKHVPDLRNFRRMQSVRVGGAVRTRYVRQVAAYGTRLGDHVSVTNYQITICRTWPGGHRAVGVQPWVRRDPHR